jgi:hypothetical protein
MEFIRDRLADNFINANLYINRSNYALQFIEVLVLPVGRQQIAHGDVIGRRRLSRVARIAFDALTPGLDPEAGEGKAQRLIQIGPDPPLSSGKAPRAVKSRSRVLRRLP